MKKTLKVLTAFSLLAPTTTVFVNHTAEAATQTQINAAVQKAKTASQALRYATSIEFKGDITVRPYTEYNAAKKAYAEARKLVDASKSSSKQVQLAQLEEVKTWIDRGAVYIDAISAGLILQNYQNQLNAKINAGVLDEDTEKLYHEMSYQIKQQALRIFKIYGASTREAVRTKYIRTAEQLRDQLSYPITVRDKLDIVKNATSTNVQKLEAGKQILLFLVTIPQANYYNQLSKEWKTIVIPEAIQDAEYKNLLSLNEDLIKLKTIIKPGISSAEVPDLYKSVSEKIAKVTNSTGAKKLSEELTETMSLLELSVGELKGKLTSEAIKAGIPPEIVKAIVITENGRFQQFTTSGEVFKSPDNGYGLMQVTPLSDTDTRYDWNRVKYDLQYNIETGMKILLEKWGYGASKRIPVINNGSKEILENWYFAIMAYNGLSKANDPTLTTLPYQVKVYENLKNGTQASPDLINSNDLVLRYNESTGQMIFSDKLSYTTTKKTKSTQMYNVGDTITLTGSANFRNAPTTSGSVATPISASTKVTIISEAIQDSNKANLYVWYKVKLSTGKEGYIASVSLK